MQVRLLGAPGAPLIRINVSAIYPNALPPNITPSSSPGSLRPAVLGAHVWAEWPHHPCLLEGPQHGDKKWKRGGETGEVGENFAGLARCATVLSILVVCTLFCSVWSRFGRLCERCRSRVRRCQALKMPGPRVSQGTLGKSLCTAHRALRRAHADVRQRYVVAHSFMNGSAPVASSRGNCSMAQRGHVRMVRGTGAMPASKRVVYRGIPGFWAPAPTLRELVQISPKSGVDISRSSVQAKKRQHKQHNSRYSRYLKALGFPNLHGIYKNLQKIHAIFCGIYKNLCNLQRKLLHIPPPPPLFTSLPPRVCLGPPAQCQC